MIFNVFERFSDVSAHLRTIRSVSDDSGTFPKDLSLGSGQVDNRMNSELFIWPRARLIDNRKHSFGGVQHLNRGLTWLTGSSGARNPAREARRIFCGYGVPSLGQNA